MNMFEVFEEQEFMEDFDILEDFRPQDERFDPFYLTKNEFYTRFRFSKESVEGHIVPLLYPDGVRAENNRGHPFEPEQVVCSTLHLLGGNSFFRIEGVCNRSSKATAHRHQTEVVDKLCILKEATVHMPNANMMRENIDAVRAKYHLPNVVGKVRGTLTLWGKYLRCPINLQCYFVSNVT